MSSQFTADNDTLDWSPFRPVVEWPQVLLSAHSTSGSDPVNPPPTTGSTGCSSPSVVVPSGFLLSNSHCNDQRIHTA